MSDKNLQIPLSIQNQQLIQQPMQQPILVPQIPPKLVNLNPHVVYLPQMHMSQQVLGSSIPQLISPVPIQQPNYTFNQPRFITLNNPHQIIDINRQPTDQSLTNSDEELWYWFNNVPYIPPFGRLSVEEAQLLNKEKSLNLEPTCPKIYTNVASPPPINPNSASLWRRKQIDNVHNRCLKRVPDWLDHEVKRHREDYLEKIQRIEPVSRNPIKFFNNSTSKKSSSVNESWVDPNLVEEDNNQLIKFFMNVTLVKVTKELINEIANERIKAYDINKLADNQQVGKVL